MEIFSLVAKLLLNTDEYEKSLQQAESDAHSVDDIEANLTLDDNDFTSKVEDANDAEVDDMESTLDLDSEPFTKGVKQAKADGKSLEGSLGDTFDGIKGLLAAAGITVAISNIVSSLSEAVDLARSMGDNIDKSSRAMSISTDAYQEWSHVLDINGANITDLNRGLMNMRKLMGGGEASKEFSEAMDQLGLSAKVANGEITSTEDLLTATMKALADFSGDGAQRDYLAQAIFGRGGTKLNAMFDGTSKDIDALIAQAHELGLVMSPEEVANAAAYNDSVTNLNASFDAFKTSLVTGVLPVLTDIFNRVAAIVAFFNPRTKETALSEQFKEIDKDLASNLADIEGTSGAASSMIDKLFSMGDATKLTAEQQAEWKSTAQWLIEKIPSLSEVIDTDTLSIKGNKEEIQKNIEEWERLSRERALSAAKEQKYQAMIEKNADAIDAQAQARAKQLDAEQLKYERAAKINQMLTESPALAKWLQNNYGLDNVSAKMENFEEVARAVSGLNAFMLQEPGYSNAELLELNAQYGKAISEQEELQKKADSYTEQLNKAQQEYDTWLKAVDELYGGVSETASDATSDVDKLGDSIGKLPLKKQISLDLVVSGGLPHFLPKAKGDWSVPWDNYPALLHRGERVLTASQARQDNSSSIGTEAVVGAISSLRNDLQQLQLVVNGKTFGRAVVDYGGNNVDNYIGSSESRLESGYGT